MRKWFLIMAAALVLCSACGKKDTSVNGVTQEAQASSTEAESLYKEGAGYVGEEDYESAIESLLKCIELDPNYSKAYIQLSKAYIGNEEYDEAEDALFSLVRAAFQAGWLAAGGEESTAVRMFEVLRAEDFRKKS